MRRGRGRRCTCGSWYAEVQAIVVQSFVAAPAPAVWAAIRERTGLLFDGLPAESWPEGGSEQPPFHMTRPWPFTAAAGGPTEVSVTLDEVGGGTRIDVRHAGWGEGPLWDTAIQGHFAGWLQGLAAVGLWLETGKDARETGGGGRERTSGAKAERYFISGEIPAEPAAVYRSLTDGAVLGRWSGNALGAMPVAEDVEDKFIRWRTGETVGTVETVAGGREITAILRATPRGTHLAIAEYGVTDRAASNRWPGVFESLAKFLG